MVKVPIRAAFSRKIPELTGISAPGASLRRAVAPVVLRSGITIAEDEDVVIDIHAANRDPAAVGPHGYRFDPFRQMADGVAPWGLSFGHGAHACLGRELAGGLEPDETLDDHLLGSIVLMAGAVLRAGACPNRDDPPTVDTGTTRNNWGRYPVVLKRREESRRGVRR